MEVAHGGVGERKQSLVSRLPRVQGMSDDWLHQTTADSAMRCRRWTFCVLDQAPETNARGETSALASEAQKARSHELAFDPWEDECDGWQVLAYGLMPGLDYGA